MMCRIAAAKSRTQEKTGSTTTSHHPHRPKHGNSLLHLQRTIGNQAVQRMLGVATAMEAPGKTGDDVMAHATPEMANADPTPAPLNEDGLIDGEWSSAAVAHTFTNGGKTGTGQVNWIGGNGGTTPNIGGITLVAPTIDTSAAPATGGTAQAWVRAGTGTAAVNRTYIGVTVGAHGVYYITAAAAARIDVHEQGHVAQSRVAHDAHIQPLENRVKQHTTQAKALSQGATEAQAKTALDTFLNWNTSITNFRNADNAANLPGGTWDTTDSASANFYHDHGARVIGGVNYAHYIDAP